MFVGRSDSLLLRNLLGHHIVDDLLQLGVLFLLARQPATPHNRSDPLEAARQLGVLAHFLWRRFFLRHTLRLMAGRNHKGLETATEMIKRNKERGCKGQRNRTGENFRTEQVESHVNYFYRIIIT